MDWQVIVVYILLLATVVLFVTDRVRTDIVGLMIISILGLLGILKPKDLLEGFSNQALVTIAAMFVLSAALMRSGVRGSLALCLRRCGLFGNTSDHRVRFIEGRRC